MFCLNETRQDRLTRKLVNGQVTLDVLLRMFSKVEADVDEQVQEDEQDLDAVFANVDVVYDAAPFQRDADFVPLTPTRDRLR